jgi:GNAT superfamily N-acetyltransferase
MFVRLALDTEEDDFVRMSVANLEETMPGEPYNEAVIRNSFQKYLSRANPTIWFVEHERKPIAFMAAYMCAFDYRDGLYTTQRVIYVLPENRGTRAAVLLVKELIRWSEALGAAKIDGGNDNSFQSDRTAGFLEHFGFKRIGLYLTKLLEERGDG